MRGFGRRVGAGFLLCVAGLVRPALAGPPFVTDDPEPTDTGRFENYLYTQGTHAGGHYVGPAAGVEINYGALPDTQLTLSLPLNPNPGPNGLGEVFVPFEIGVKYRFIEEDDAGWRPQVAFFPQLQMPVGAATENTPTTLLLPLWAQKSFGAWTTFGGGGFTVNPGRGNRGFVSYGWALARQLDARLQMGVEVFGQSRDSVTDAASAAVGVGGIYDFNETWHLIGSVNTGIVNRADDEFSYTLALKWTF